MTENHLEPEVFTGEGFSKVRPDMSQKERMAYAGEHTWDIIKKIWIYLVMLHNSYQTCLLMVVELFQDNLEPVVEYIHDNLDNQYICNNHQPVPRHPTVHF